MLEYLSPRNGRPRPLETAANDLVFWQTTVLLADADAAERTTRSARAVWISPGVVEVPGGALGFTRALAVADPDGHALRLAEVARLGDAR